MVSVLKLEAADASKILIRIYQTTWHHFPEDHNLIITDSVILNIKLIIMVCLDSTEHPTAVFAFVPEFGVEQNCITQNKGIRIETYSWRFGVCRQ
jgi:hypothetical protein